MTIAAPPLSPPLPPGASSSFPLKNFWFWAALSIALFTLAPVAVVFTY